MHGVWDTLKERNDGIRREIVRGNVRKSSSLTFYCCPKCTSVTFCIIVYDQCNNVLNVVATCMCTVFRLNTTKITKFTTRDTLVTMVCWLNTLRPRRNEQHFADDIFKRIFFNKDVWIAIKTLQKFVPKGPINNIPALVQIMAWRRSGDKPLSESMMVSLPTHIWVARPQWVKKFDS